MALTDTQRTNAQDLRDTINTEALLYGDNTIVRSLRFVVNDGGTVTGLLVEINADSGADRDGEKVKYIKEINIW